MMLSGYVWKPSSKWLSARPKQQFSVSFYGGSSFSLLCTGLPSSVKLVYISAGLCKLILSGFTCEVGHKTKSLNTALRPEVHLSLPKRLLQFVLSGEGTSQDSCIWRQHESLCSCLDSNPSWNLNILGYHSSEKLRKITEVLRNRMKIIWAGPARKRQAATSSKHAVFSLSELLNPQFHQHNEPLRKPSHKSCSG